MGELHWLERASARSRRTHVAACSSPRVKVPTAPCTSSLLAPKPSAWWSNKDSTPLLPPLAAGTGRRPTSTTTRRAPTSRRWNRGRPPPGGCGERYMDFSIRAPLESPIIIVPRRRCPAKGPRRPHRVQDRRAIVDGPAWTSLPCPALPCPRLDPGHRTHDAPGRSFAPRDERTHAPSAETAVEQARPDWRTRRAHGHGPW